MPPRREPSKPVQSDRRLTLPAADDEDDDDLPPPSLILNRPINPLPASTRGSSRPPPPTSSSSAPPPSTSKASTSTSPFFTPGFRAPANLPHAKKKNASKAKDTKPTRQVDLFGKKADMTKKAPATSTMAAKPKAEPKGHVQTLTDMLASGLKKGLQKNLEIPEYEFENGGEDKLIIG